MYPFPDGLLSLSDMHLDSSMSFQGLIAHFFSVLNNSPLSDVLWFIYPLTYLKILIASKLGNYE